MGYKVPGWVCVPHNADADHDWEVQTDSAGDHEVIGGIMTFHYWQCAQCGLIDEYREVTSEDLSDDYDDWRD